MEPTFSWARAHRRAAIPAMTDKPQKKGLVGRTLKLVGMIVLVLLVPLAMDQFDVDRDQLKITGRVCAGFAGLLFLYGIFTKLLKVMAFVVLLLIGGVVLVSEQQLEMPRVKELFAERTDDVKAGNRRR
jgi:hypothetical protein